MADRIDKLTNRVQALEKGVGEGFKAVDARFTAVDARFEAFDARFDAIDAALVEQRKYTEFAYSRLDTRMDAGFSRTDASFSRLERKMDQFIEVQTRTNGLVERRLTSLERRRRQRHGRG